MLSVNIPCNYPTYCVNVIQYNPGISPLAKYSYNRVKYIVYPKHERQLELCVVFNVSRDREREQESMCGSERALSKQVIIVVNSKIGRPLGVLVLKCPTLT